MQNRIQLIYSGTHTGTDFKTMMISYFLCCFIVFSQGCFGDNQDIAKFTLEEKIGQMLMVHFTGELANEDSLQLIREAHIGAFIYYNWSNGLDNPFQVKNLSLGLQQQALTTRLKIPLLIATDQEGGRVTRLVKNFTTFPDNAIWTKIDDDTLIYKYGTIMAKELMAVGINVDLAPVVDINDNPTNPVIGIRSFGSTPEKVIAKTTQIIKGFHEIGLIATLKHFPGHGNTNIDSHIALPTINKSREDLEKCELQPFRQLSTQTDMIMTAHILVPALDPKHCATLSRLILEDLLRKEMRFEGVIISDSLVMQGILNCCSSIEEVAIQAIQAGCDLLTLGGKQLKEGSPSNELTIKDVLNVHKAIVAAVKEGRIPETRINSSVERILQLKQKYLWDNHSCKYPLECVKCLEHTQFVDRITHMVN